MCHYKIRIQKEIGRLVQVIKDLEYCLNVEEYFRMDTLYPTHISMWCCNGILWMTEDKRVVTATDSMREVFGLGKYERNGADPNGLTKSS